MKINTTNGRHISITESPRGGLAVFHYDSAGAIDKAYRISESDLVMLICYYNDCKNGTIESGFILPR